MNKLSKKIAAAVMAVAMVAAVMTGCGSKEEKADEIVGTWKASTVEAAGVSVDFDQYAEQLGQSADSFKMEMEIKEDKTMSMDMAGQKAEGTWEKKDDKYTLTISGADQEVSITDGKLVFEEQATNVKITFVKK